MLGIFFSVFIAFFATILIARPTIHYLYKIGLIVKDLHKKGQPPVTLSGGLIVLFGFLLGTMSFIFFTTFVPSETIPLDTRQLNLLFAGLLSIIVITFIGFIDDFFINKSKDSAIGLNQWQKPLLTVIAAIPLMVVNAGTQDLIIPFIGHINLGILYPLFLVPVVVVGASNMVNMFGGFNGLESGLGIIYLASLGLFAYIHERHIAAIIALMVFLPLLIFFYYNKVPAKIIAGNSLTYLLGGTLATIAIIGNIEKAAFIISIPFFAEASLKFRGKLKKTTVGYEKNGKIYSQYAKIYSLPHFFMNGKYTEKQIVYFMFCIELIFALAIWVV